MIEYGYRDILKTDAECIVNTVNCHVHTLADMKKPQAGLAGMFEKEFPSIQEGLQNVCREKGDRGMKPGRVFFQKVDRKTRQRTADGDMVIANIATKDHWAPPSKMAWVSRGIKTLADQVEKRGIKSVAIPKIGAGFGKLEWKDVQREIHMAFAPLAAKGVKVYVLGDDVNGLNHSGPNISHRDANEHTYAGIGARDTPPAVIKKMERIGFLMGKAGVTLRSGGAIGADTAFEDGAKAAGSARQIFFPKRVLNGRTANGDDLILKITPAHLALAEKHYRHSRQTFAQAPEWTQSLMARNGSQVLGENLDSPSGLVLCYTSNGGIKGGTGQALRIAEDENIPVINLGAKPWKDLDAEKIAEAAIKVTKKEATIEDVTNEHDDQGYIIIGSGDVAKKPKRKSRGFER